MFGRVVDDLNLAFFVYVSISSFYRLASGINPWLGTWGAMKGLHQRVCAEFRFDILRMETQGKRMGSN
jgi:hypothetical protein